MHTHGTVLHPSRLCRYIPPLVNGFRWECTRLRCATIRWSGTRTLSEAPPSTSQLHTTMSRSLPSPISPVAYDPYSSVLASGHTHDTVHKASPELFTPADLTYGARAV
jgi:hypothetical protein